MRKLASVQKIKKVEPIEGADRIELVHVLGWQVVTQKGEFKEGDYCVYFEIDSFLPIDERFEFLRASSYRNSELLGEGFRLRTQKMRGQISQGLVLPAKDFPELWYDPIEGMNSVVPCEGQDVTELLGVRKWEIPEMATTGGTVVSERPYFIPYTDETRIQAAPEIIEEFDIPYYITTKMDGSSHSVGIDENGDVYVTGHNYTYADDGQSAFYEYLKKRGILDTIRKMKDYLKADTLAVQGELCGAGIQKNRLKLKSPVWYVFDIRCDGKRADYKKLFDLCSRFELTMVPVEEEGESLAEKYPTEEDLLRRAEGQYPNGGPKEGIVIRPKVPVYSRTLQADLSIKVINNKYLLKHDKD